MRQTFFQENFFNSSTHFYVQVHYNQRSSATCLPSQLPSVSSRCPRNQSAAPCGGNRKRWQLVWSSGHSGDTTCTTWTKCRTAGQSVGGGTGSLITGSPGWWWWLHLSFWWWWFSTALLSYLSAFFLKSLLFSVYLTHTKFYCNHQNYVLTALTLSQSVVNEHIKSELTQMLTTRFISDRAMASSKHNILRKYKTFRLKLNWIPTFRPKIES